MCLPTTRASGDRDPDARGATGKTKLTARSRFPTAEALEGALVTGMVGGAIESWDRLEEEAQRGCPGPHPRTNVRREVPAGVVLLGPRSAPRMGSAVEIVVDNLVDRPPSQAVQRRVAFAADATRIIGTHPRLATRVGVNAASSRRHSRPCPNGRPHPPRARQHPTRPGSHRPPTSSSSSVSAITDAMSAGRSSTTRCAVAARREFNGWDHDQLAEHGLTFSLTEMPRLAGWVRTVLGPHPSTRGGPSGHRPARAGPCLTASLAGPAGPSGTIAGSGSRAAEQGRNQVGSYPHVPPALHRAIHNCARDGRMTDGLVRVPAGHLAIIMRSMTMYFSIRRRSSLASGV